MLLRLMGFLRRLLRSLLLKARNLMGWHVEIVKETVALSCEFFASCLGILSLRESCDDILFWAITTLREEPFFWMFRYTDSEA